MPSTEISTIEPGGYLALNTGPEQIMEAFRVNLGDEKLSKFDLDKATVTVGATRWRVARQDGTVDDPQSITGVIISIAKSRAYYKTAYSSGGEAPDCSSFDGGRTGIGDPGGVCTTCPMNEFGTAREGSGKACAEGLQLLLLPKDSIMPILVQVPAASLKGVKGYLTSLAGVMLPVTHVETELTIGTRSTQSRGEVSAVVARRVGNLDPAEVALASEYAARLNDLITADAPPAPRVGPDGEAPKPWEATGESDVTPADAVEV